MLGKSDLILLELIKKALNCNYQVNASYFNDIDNWDELMLTANDQGVLGVCFDAFDQLPKECRPERHALLQWWGQVYVLEDTYEKYEKAIKRLAGFYEENGIRMMLLKGYGMSRYWPCSKHRPTGDIDIYLGDKWKLGDQLINQKLGIKVEDGHEHHTIFTFKDIMVENHYDFINTRAHKDAQDIESHLKELAWKEVLPSENDGIENPYFPSPDCNVIFLIRHLGQHFAGEKVLLRQILDWGLFLQREEKNIDWNSAISYLKGMGIWTFFNQINAICVNYLGISLPDSLYAEENSDLELRILEDILHPEFGEEKPKGLVPILVFKMKRWWYNRWKHPLIYNEWLLPMFLTLLWSHIRRIKTIKD